MKKFYRKGVRLMKFTKDELDDLGHVPNGVTDDDGTWAFDKIGRKYAYYKLLVYKPDKTEFGITTEECYFCGQPRTIRYGEHYTFCPNCTAIYTNMILHSSRCHHINDETPFVERESHGGKPGPERKHFIYKDPKGIQRCSECGAECLSDGW